MKNRIFAFITGALATAALSGCNDYLDRLPLDSNSDATNWKNEAAIQTYAWNHYGDLSSFSYGSGWTRGQYHGEALTDDYTTESFSQFTRNIPSSSGSWTNPYAYIREANVMLSRIDRVPDITEAAANHWRGVARVFRALWHFELVKTYGDVVWVDEEITDISNAETLGRSRDSRVDVISNIIEDLDFAVNNCYEPAQAGANVINKYVAAALGSRIALYEAAWEKYHKTPDGKSAEFYGKAKDFADAVISSGLYEINEKYKENYISKNLDGNTEMILFKRYAYTSTGGAVSHAHATFGWSDSSTPTWGLTKSAVENYAGSDGLPIHMKAYDDKTVAGVFGGRDARLILTVHPFVVPVVGNAYIEGIVSTTGYWTWKFVPLDEYETRIGNSTWNGPYNDTDGPIFAYPEVLLNYAEACAELGSCTQADLDKSVNVLRTKHGNIPVLTVSGTTVSCGGTTITAAPNDPAPNVLIQEIRRERRSELMGDGFRHADLMRWALGKNLDIAENPAGYVGASRNLILIYANANSVTEDTIDEKNYFVTIDGTQYKSAYEPGVNSRTWDDKYYLEPIPSGQITLDENLGQNPGW